MSKLIELFSSDAFKEAAAEDAKNSGVGAASILDGLMSTVGSFGNYVGGMEGTTRLQDAITGTDRGEKTEDRIARALALLDRTENAVELKAPKAAAPKAAAPKAAAPKAAEPKAAEPKAAEPAAKSKLTVNPYTRGQEILLKNVAETTAANQELDIDRFDAEVREEAKERLLAKVNEDLALEEAALKKEHLAMREADRQASNEGMAGALKAEAARQASNEGMAGQLKSEAARQASVAEKAKEPVTRGDLDPDMQDMMGTTGVDPDDYDLAGGAEEPEVDYTDKAISLFKNTHGSDFDPNSVKDKGKLEDMKKLLAQNKGKEMSPNQFALQFYRESM